MMNGDQKFKELPNDSSTPQNQSPHEPTTYTNLTFDLYTTRFNSTKLAELLFNHFKQLLQKESS